MKPKNTSGFTLLELLIVIAVIGIFSAIISFSTTSSRVRAADAVRIRNMDEIEKALELYYADRKVYPAVEARSLVSGTILTEKYCTDNPTVHGWCDLRVMLQPYMKLPFPPNQDDITADLTIDGYDFQDFDIFYVYKSVYEDNYQSYGLATPLYSSGNYDLMKNDGGVYNTPTSSGVPGTYWLPMYEKGTLPKYCAATYTSLGKNWLDTLFERCTGLR